MAVEVIFCYSHKDERLLHKLKIQLKPLLREGLVNLWHNRDISAGKEWEQEIDEHLNTAQIILLLVSPDFIDSDYCYSIEMERAIERHERGEVRTIPVILRPTDWHNTPLRKLQALPMDGKPITLWTNRDKALLDAARGIRKAVEEMSKRSLENTSLMPNPKRTNIRSQQYQNNQEKGIHITQTKGVDEEALTKLREEMQHRSDADRLLLEADKFASDPFEKERLIKQAVEIYPEYKLSRYRQLGIEMSIEVLRNSDPYESMFKRLVGYDFNFKFTKDKFLKLTTNAIYYLREAILDTTTKDTECLGYLACMYGYQQQFDEMLGSIDKAVQIDKDIKEEFREPIKLVALLRACNSNLANIAMLGKRIGLVLPASKDTFCNFLKNDNLKERDTFIEWLAINRSEAIGAPGIFVIKITPPYTSNQGLVNATALRLEDGQIETIVPVDKNVSIEELFDKLDQLFFLISPNR